MRRGSGARRSVGLGVGLGLVVIVMALVVLMPRTAEARRPARQPAHPKSFPLAGGHADVACASCHPQATSKVFTGAAKTCAGCHATPAHGDFGPCEPCHTPQAFAPSRFSHDITRFAIAGAHVPLGCPACHQGGERFVPFDDGPGRCVSCHPGPHGAQFGGAPDSAKPAPACDACHTQVAFAPSTITAATHGTFALDGRHAQTACAACHQKGRFAGVATTCQGCHADVHRARLKGDCARCHDTAAWTPRAPFDHARETGVALTGRHERVACAACHGAPGQRKILAASGAPTCAACHAPGRHGLQYGTACGTCHDPRGWKPRAAFDHGTTQFPLERRHRVVACLSCHDASRGVRAQSACQSCHTDVHRGRAGTACEDCHRPDRWTVVRFDHDRAEFRLAGRHRLTPCADCHTNDTWVGLRAECITCHVADRPRTSDHATVSDCAGAGCHTPISWKAIRR